VVINDKDPPRFLVINWKDLFLLYSKENPSCETSNEFLTSCSHTNDNFVDWFFHTGNTWLNYILLVFANGFTNVIPFIYLYTGITFIDKRVRYGFLYGFSLIWLKYWRGFLKGIICWCSISWYYIINPHK
jgi:hypothetical protein